MMSGCTPLEPARTYSDGVLSQVVSVHGARVRLIAVYQPAGLDSAPAPSYLQSPGRPMFEHFLGVKDCEGAYIRAVGEWQCGLVSRLLKEPGVCCTIAAGDFNEVPDGVIDRAVRVPEGADRGSASRSHTIGKLVSCATDLYRLVHPLSRAMVAAGASHAQQEHTFFGGKGRGSSRIDLSLVFPKLVSGKGACAFVDDGMLSDGVDHRPVCFCLPLPAGVRFHHRQGSGPLPWRAKNIFAEGLSPHAVAALGRACNKPVATSNETWIPALEAVRPSDTGVLQSCLKEFMETIFAAAFSVAGGRKASASARPAASARLRRFRAVRRQVVRLRVAVSRSLALGGTCWSLSATNALRTLRHLKALHLAGLDYVPKWLDVDGWSTWIACVPGVMKSLRYEIRSAVRAHRCHPSNRTYDLFKTSRGRGVYYSDCVGSSAGICEFTDEDGLVHTDPDVVKTKVAERVGARFNNPRAAPAVYVGRENTSDELATGKPFWWDAVYEPVSGSQYLWDRLMREVELCEVYAWLRKGGNPVPGPDGFPKAALRAAAGLITGSDSLPETPTPVVCFLIAYFMLVSALVFALHLRMREKLL